MLAMVAADAAAQQKAAEQKIVLGLQSAFAAVLPALGECLPFFKEYVDAASDGSIEVKYFDPGKLVPAFEIHDAVSSGKIEAGYTAPVYLAGKASGDRAVHVYPLRRRCPGLSSAGFTAATA
ncbi:MAG: hypothetical protein MZV70_41125 [Desulfobacterales bacterium]|nr:hypothetical protein [Desulfobacterales bacterium]